MSGRDCQTCAWRHECVSACTGYTPDPDLDDGDYDEDADEEP